MAPASPMRLFGIPIQVAPSWFPMVGLLTFTLAHGYFPAAYAGLPAPTYWLMGTVAALLLFVCVLLHELGHSLAARRYGIPVARVVLFIFGGVAQISRSPRRPSDELVVALAGPAVSLLLAAGCLFAARQVTGGGTAPRVATAILHYLTILNLGVLCFNLLPGLPLDGGRVLRALLWAWTGSLPRATRAAAVLGAGLGLGLLALGVWALTRRVWMGGLWYGCLGLFLWRAARSSFQRSTGA